MRFTIYRGRSQSGILLSVVVARAGCTPAFLSCFGCGRDAASLPAVALPTRVEFIVLFISCSDILEKDWIARFTRRQARHLLLDPTPHSMHEVPLRVTIAIFCTDNRVICILGSAFKKNVDHEAKKHEVAILCEDDRRSVVLIQGRSCRRQD